MGQEQNVKRREKALRELALLQSAAITAALCGDDAPLLRHSLKLCRAVRANLTAERNAYDARDFRRIAALLGSVTAAVAGMKKYRKREEFSFYSAALDKSVADIGRESAAVREKIAGSASAEKLCEYFDKLSRLFADGPSGTRSAVICLPGDESGKRDD